MFFGSSRWEGLLSSTTSQQHHHISYHTAAATPLEESLLAGGRARASHRVASASPPSRVFFRRRGVVVALFAFRSCDGARPRMVRGKQCIGGVRSTLCAAVPSSQQQRGCGGVAAPSLSLPFSAVPVRIGIIAVTTRPLLGQHSPQPRGCAWRGSWRQTLSFCGGLHRLGAGETTQRLSRPLSRMGEVALSPTGVREGPPWSAPAQGSVRLRIASGMWPHGGTTWLHDRPRESPCTMPRHTGPFGRRRALAECSSAERRCC